MINEGTAYGTALNPSSACRPGAAWITRRHGLRHRPCGEAHPRAARTEGRRRPWRGGEGFGQRARRTEWFEGRHGSRRFRGGCQDYQFALPALTDHLAGGSGATVVVQTTEHPQTRRFRHHLQAGARSWRTILEADILDQAGIPTAAADPIDRFSPFILHLISAQKKRLLHSLRHFVHISRFMHKTTRFERPKDTGSIRWPLGATSVRLTHLRHPTSGHSLKPP
jgi:hypothetical protein